MSDLFQVFQLIPNGDAVCVHQHSSVSQAEQQAAASGGTAAKHCWTLLANAQDRTQ